MNPDGTVKSKTKIASETNGGPLLAAGDRFGTSVTSLGDLNGDGITDLAVGADQQFASQENFGVVYVLFLDSNGIVKRPLTQEITHNQAGMGSFELNAQFGSAVAALGDVDGDGTTDLAVGSRMSELVQLLFLTPEGTVRNAKPVFDREFRSLAAVGDLDYDGINELAVGTSIDWNILYLNNDGTVRQEIAEESFVPISAIAAVGDWNGDHVSDLVMGIPAPDQNLGSIGKLFVKVLRTMEFGDLGDAPDTHAGTGPWNYNTRWTDNGPRHLLPGGAWIGDEPYLDDGVTNPIESLALVGGDAATVNVVVTNYGGESTLYGWIDTNFDGVFDNDTERASVVVPPNTIGAVTLTFPSIPSGIDGRTYARFRISTDDAAANPTGVASDGEVEDYVVTITSPTTVALLEKVDFPFGSNRGTSRKFTDLGDVNGDGINDFAMGSELLFMNEKGEVASTVPLLNENHTALGDINGDGIPDIAFGAYTDGADDENLTGAVYVVLLDRDGSVLLDQDGNKQFTKIASGLNGGPVITGFRSLFGWRVVSMGDLDNDGNTDLAVSQGQWSNKVYILFLDQDRTVKSYVLNEVKNGGSFGISLANLGDFDGDGVTDLVVGANKLDAYKNGEIIDDVGGVYIVLMNSDGTFKQTTLISHGPGLLLNQENFFGFSVSVLGDVNDDGITDIAVAAIYSDVGGLDGGAVYAITLNSDGSLMNSSVIITGPPGNAYGRRLTTLDDLDHNGIRELALGTKYILYLTRETPDFGDAPESYNIASHTTNPNIFLGGFVDAEPSANPGISATGDDILGGFSSDEDGLVNPLRDLSLISGVAPTVDVIVTNTTGSDATLYGWIDGIMDGVIDGDFDLDERASITVLDGSIGEVVTLTFSGTVPENAAGKTYARFRLSTDGAAVAEPTGPASDGEVEDYVATIVKYDFGDAPDRSSSTGPANYNTLSDHNGPSHLIDRSIYLGSTIDVEAEALQNLQADGDDVAGGVGDEDGLVNPARDLRLTAGIAPTVEVRVKNESGSTAKLYGWIDFNADGKFDNSSEQADPKTITSPTNDIFVLTFPPVPAGYVGETYARFRLTTDNPTVMHPTGPASDGEVEDYLVNIVNLDYGDAPDTGALPGPGNYSTLASHDGPVHQIVSGLYLGSGVDNELDSLQIYINDDTQDDGTQRLSANGDDQSGSTPDDEDGLLDPSIDLKLTIGQLPEVGVTVTNTTGRSAKLYGWIDFDRNGVFNNDNERTSSSVPNGETGSVVTLTFDPVPAGHLGTTYARFRLSTDDAEDYVVTIAEPGDGTVLPTSETIVQSSMMIAAGEPNLNALHDYDKRGYPLDARRPTSCDFHRQAAGTVSRASQQPAA